jgi:tRNA modification GTPase
MFSTSDTIVAVATPPGRGGLGVVRLSGPDAHAIARRLTMRTSPFSPRHATFTRISVDQAPIDHVVATFFPHPKSYTGDDTVEFTAHGSVVVLRAIVAAAADAGARLAEPGEFTLRAFLNGRIDLMQAEAVADLIDAVTPLQARVAFDQLQGTLTGAIGAISEALFELMARLEASVDFPEEGYHFLEPVDLKVVLDALVARLSQLMADADRGRLIREGFQIAIVGKPNVGKSSLFNALIGASRSIVTAIPGTTRDVLTDVVDIDGFRVTLVDTAGLRPTEDEVEAEGVARARQAIGSSDLVLVVIDGSQPLEPADHDVLIQTSENKRLIVMNKCDISRTLEGDVDVQVSARTGIGLDALRRRLTTALDFEPARDRPAISNLRHIVLVRQAHDALTRAQHAVGASGRDLPEEFVLADLQQAQAALDEVSGRRAPDELLNHIFSRFCVGK